MKPATKFLIAILSGLLGFVVAFVGVMCIQFAIHGDQTFEHDAGAEWAVTMTGFFVAAPVALGCTVLAFWLLHSRERKLGSPAVR